MASRVLDLVGCSKRSQVERDAQRGPESFEGLDRRVRLSSLDPTDLALWDSGCLGKVLLSKSRSKTTLKQTSTNGEPLPGLGESLPLIGVALKFFNEVTEVGAHRVAPRSVGHDMSYITYRPGREET
jgi:hypothetical protein